jgi:hypothetical protein
MPAIIVPIAVAAARYGMSTAALKMFFKGKALPTQPTAMAAVDAALHYIRTGVARTLSSSTVGATATGISEVATYSSNGGSSMKVELGKQMGTAGFLNGTHPGLPFATSEWTTSWDSDRTGEGAFKTIIYKYPGQKRGVAWGTWTKGPKEGQFVTWRQPRKPITISRKATTIQDYLKAEGVIRKFKGKLATARRSSARRRTRR